MTHENKHTPTPWQLKPGETGVNYIRIRGTSLGHRYKIANVSCPFWKGMHEMEHDHEESRANAAFIVRACNAHDELVDVAREALLVAGAIGAGREIDPEIFAGWSRTIGSVLAKARGEQ